MQVKSLSDCSLDWFEREEFGQEFEELMPRRLTNIAPLLRRINFKNSLSFELDSISFCLSLLAVITNNNNNNFSDNNLTKNLNLELYPFGRRTDGQTSQHVIYNESCVKSLPL